MDKIMKFSNERTKLANDYYYLKNKLNKHIYKGVKGSNQRLTDVNNYYYLGNKLNYINRFLGY